jgi:NAD(P)-dependent dehydrogenase (short-subunit alcohol dehydrogenase family)
MLLENKIAMVISGSQGIGEAIARRYAAEGAKLAVAYQSNDQKAAARSTARFWSRPRLRTLPAPALRPMIVNP